MTILEMNFYYNVRKTAVFIYSFTLIFSKCLLQYVPSPVLGTGEQMLSKIKMASAFTALGATRGQVR